jgi:hypothetical protein
VSQQSLKPVDGDRSFSPEGFHLLSISVQLLTLGIAQGRVLLIVLIFIVDVVVLLLLLLLLLLSRCTLGCWAPRCHQHDLKRLLLLRHVLWSIMLWLLRLWHVTRCQLTSRLTTGALMCGAARMNHLSFRKRRV